MTMLKFIVLILLLAVVILLLASLLEGAADWLVKNCNQKWFSRCAAALVAAGCIVFIKFVWLNDEEG